MRESLVSAACAGCSGDCIAADAMATVEKNSRRLLDVSCSDVVCILGCCFVLVVNALTDATVAVIIAMRKDTILKTGFV